MMGRLLRSCSRSTGMNATRHVASKRKFTVIGVWGPSGDDLARASRAGLFSRSASGSRTCPAFRSAMKLAQFENVNAGVGDRVLSFFFALWHVARPFRGPRSDRPSPMQQRPGIG